MTQAEVFLDFTLLSTRAEALGCYIDFSGFSTSWAYLALEDFLNTNCVTASIAVHPRRQYE
jgi:hypothetical protein